MLQSLFFTFPVQDHIKSRWPLRTPFDSLEKTWWRLGNNCCSVPWPCGLYLVTFFQITFCKGNSGQQGASWQRLRSRKKLKVACFLFWPTWPVFISGGIFCIFCPKHSPSFQLSCRCVLKIEYMTSEIAVTSYLAGSMLCLQNQCGGYVCHIFSFFFSSGVVVRA